MGKKKPQERGGGRTPQGKGLAGHGGRTDANDLLRVRRRGGRDASRGILEWGVLRKGRAKIGDSSGLKLRKCMKRMGTDPPRAASSDTVANKKK